MLGDVVQAAAAMHGALVFARQERRWTLFGRRHAVRIDAVAEAVRDPAAALVGCMLERCVRDDADARARLRSARDAFANAVPAKERSGGPFASAARDAGRVAWWRRS